jgi:hypothetical protein
LLEVGESTFIGREVILSSLSYQDQTCKRHSICIGSQCFINTSCVLYERVIVHDHVYMQPICEITGQIVTSINHTSIENRSLSLFQTMYPFTCLLCLLFIHGIVLRLVFAIYHYSLTPLVPSFASLALSWFVWTIANLFIVLFLLKSIVDPVTPGQYPLNSYYYLHKFWLHQLRISSFYHWLDFVPSYDVLVFIITVTRRFYRR